MSIDLDFLDEDITKLDRLMDGVPETVQGTEKGANIRQIPIDQITPDPNQPRRSIDEKKLIELANSIKGTRPDGTTRGILQPISVRQTGDTYTINHGERRYRAAKMAGLLTVPASVDNGFDQIDQVVENIQREELSPDDIANFISMQVNSGVSQKDIAAFLGTHKTYVSNHLSFGQLDPVLRGLWDLDLCKSVQSLARLQAKYQKYPDEISALCAKQEPLTLRQVNAFIDGLGKPEKPNPIKQEPKDKASVSELAPQLTENQAHSRSNEGEQQSNEKSKDSTALIGRSEIEVMCDGRDGKVVFRAAEYGKAWILFTDSEKPECVNTSSLEVRAIKCTY